MSRSPAPLPLIALLIPPESRPVVSPEKVVGSTRAARGVARAASDANIPRNPPVYLTFFATCLAPK